MVSISPVFGSIKIILVETGIGVHQAGRSLIRKLSHTSAALSRELLFHYIDITLLFLNFPFNLDYQWTLSTVPDLGIQLLDGALELSQLLLHGLPLLLSEVHALALLELERQFEVALNVVDRVSLLGHPLLHITQSHCIRCIRIVELLLNRFYLLG